MKTIPLTRGKVTLVDDDVYEWASKLKWYALKGRAGAGFRVGCGISSKRDYYSLHGGIMRPAPGLQVDHINGDGLDNRRENLRVVTEQQNKWGFRKPKTGFTSKYRGVTWNVYAGKWKARLKRSGKEFHIGYFDCEEEAAKAYDVAARRLFGEFAQLNFP